MTVTVSNIVVVGYGLIGPRHAHAIEQCPGTQLVAIVEAGPNNSRRLQAHLDFPQAEVFCSLEECLLSGLRVDGAVVCTPNHTHYTISKQLLEHGVNVLVEKPITPSIKEAQHLKEIAEERGLKLLVGHHRRFNPYVLASKKHLGRLGHVVAVDAVWCLKKCDEYFEQAEWRTLKSQGGGVLQINLVHDLDLLQYFLGPLKQVYATEVIRTRNDDGPDSVEEGAVIHMTFANGTRGSMIVCDNVVSPYNFEMGTGENPLIPKCENGVDGVFYRFFGTRGSLSVPDLTLFHQEGGKGGWWEKILKELITESLDDIPFALQMKHFSQVVQGLEEPSCTADDGIRAMAAVEAVIKSLESNLPVDV
jgi:myo-inositol 2-dehydrogenase/D-chiro-inositol 1-dehydrogenase